MGSLPIEVFKKGSLVSLDLSQEDARRQVLQALENNGYVVLKRATTLDSSEQARRNKYVTAFLASARDGRFDHSQPIHKPYSTLSLVPSGRPPNWRELAKEQELVAITCYHLGGAESVKWTLEYNAGLRGELVNHTATIEASGRDIIICNSWLARPLPRPEKEVDMIMVMHRWTDFSWNE